ncbi:MAG: glucose-1-phosphate thymidylyltransferase [Nitrososphaerales archaeon]
MKGLLLAGGYGTRLRPLTFTGNKHTLPIANKPMILYGLDALCRAGVKEVGVVVGPLREGVVELIGDGSKFGVEVTYIEQSEPKGLAHAVLVSERFLGNEPFVMHLGDNLLKEGVKPFIDLFESGGFDCVVGAAKVREPSRYGIIDFDSSGRVKRLVEKPKEYISDWALIGTYVFNEKIFDAVKQLKPSWRGELEITEAIQHLLDRGCRVHVRFVQGWWKDTGRPEDLLEANQLILHDIETRIEGVVEGDATVSGSVVIGRNSIVRSGSTIRGPAVIGESCEIGPRAYIGPYTSIGSGVKVRYSEVENSIVMDEALIDCGRRVVDSVIGRGAKVVSSDGNLPKGHKLILGDTTYVSL